MRRVIDPGVEQCNAAPSKDQEHEVFIRVQGPVTIGDMIVSEFGSGDNERMPAQKAGGPYKCHKHGWFCRGRSGFIGPGTWL